MASTGAYFFLELAIVVYVLGFGWEYWHTAQLGSRTFLFAAGFLGCFWFALDQIAVRLGLWTFPSNGTLPFRLFDLPIEEYILFFLHTLICFVLVKQCSRDVL
jgi:lycopene cyclase domain-containing protein